MRKPSPEEFQRALEGTGDEAEMQALVRLVKALEQLGGPTQKHRRRAPGELLSRSGPYSRDRD